MAGELTVEATNVLLVLAARSCRRAEERLDPYPLLIRAVLDSPKTRPIIVGFEKHLTLDTNLSRRTKSDRNGRLLGPTSMVEESTKPTSDVSPTRSSPKRILLTGATGTLGYNVLRLLAARADVHVIAPIRGTHPRLRDFPRSVHFIEHELSDAVHTAQIFERARPDVILHCAASGLRPPKGTWFDMMRFNVESTLGLFQMNCRFNHKSRFIYISTGLVYRNQNRALVESDPIEALHPYGASKAAADLMLQAAASEFGRQLTILRPFSFTGRHDGGGRLFPHLLTSSLAGAPVEMTDGLQVRDFCAVNDIARGVVAAVDREQESLVEKFNLGSGQARTVRDLVERVVAELGLQTNLLFGVRKAHAYEPHHLVADTALARQALRWQPEISLSYAVWQLAQEITPELNLKEPDHSPWPTLPT